MLIPDRTAISSVFTSSPYACPISARTPAQREDNHPPALLDHGGMRKVPGYSAEGGGGACGTRVYTQGRCVGMAQSAGEQGRTFQTLLRLAACGFASRAAHRHRLDG